MHRPALSALVLATCALALVAAPASADTAKAGAFKRLYTDGASATSYLQNNWNRYTENYHPSYALDDDPKTAWVEGAEGDGHGEETCQQCHMPGGDHRFRGSHDEDYLKGALSVEVREQGGGYALLLKSRGVGHHLPTGDLFRHLTVEIAAPGSETFVEVARLGRRFDLVHNAESGRYGKRLVEDTSLRPFEERLVPVARPEGLRFRVRYFFTAQRNLARTALPLEQLARVVAEGEAPPLSAPPPASRP